MRIKAFFRGLVRLFLTLTFLLTVFACVGVAAAGLYVGVYLDTDLDDALLEHAATGRTTRLYCYDGNGTARELEDDRIGGSENSIYCPIEEIPVSLQNAFVAIEDKRFYRHRGIDWARTLSAALSYLKNGRADFGGSTITQQLVKNLTGESEKNARRKAAELMRAAKLEEKLTKREILERYLNVINLAENCYGVRTAANFYFSKEPCELTTAEAACLAAVTKSPAYYDPLKHPEENRARRDIVLGEMRAQGMIGEEEYRAAVESETVLHVDENAGTARVNSWYADLVVSDVIDGLVRERGLTESEASRLVYGGGLKIYTAMNPEIQAIVTAYYGDPDRFPTHENGEKAQSAMLIVNPKNGDILAVAGAVGEKRSNRVQNYAVDAKRPSGSVIKPLSVYAPALEAGRITMATVYDDVPLTFKKSGAPWPRNAPNLYRGLVDVRTALTHSINTVSVRVLEDLGVEASYRYLADALGFVSLDPEADRGAAALALGQQQNGVTLREVLGGYTALANEGVFEGTRSYYKVLDRHDEILLSSVPAERRVMRRENAAILTMMLRQVVRCGTGKAVTLGDLTDSAGKTGTTSGSCDKWFIGYTPELLAGVWYGHEYPRALTDVSGNPALTVYDELLREILTAHPPEKTQFDTPGELVAVRYCTDSGGLPCEACGLDPRGDRLAVGYFEKGSEPTEPCDRHVIVDYCRCGGVATVHCPAEDVCQTALLRVTRSFPRQIRVLDAPYTYGGPIPDCEPILSDNAPYYAIYYPSEHYFGVAMETVPYNRFCPVHDVDEFFRRRADIK